MAFEYLTRLTPTHLSSAKGMKRLFEIFKAFTAISTVQYSMMITAAIISSFAVPDSSSVPHHHVYTVCMRF